MRLRGDRVPVGYRAGGLGLMPTIQEILQITNRNRAAIFQCQLQASKSYDVAYFNGKMDALDHIYALLTEGE
jgi:hypothetical protein